MVVTRSQSGDADKVPKRSEEPPRSSSATTSAARPELREPVPKGAPGGQVEMEEPTTSTRITHTHEQSSVREVRATPQTACPARSASVRSTNSVAQRVRQAELEAEERLMELRRRELKLEEELITKRLAFQVASIQEEGSQHDPAEVTVDDPVEERIDSWLRRSEPRAPTPPRGELLSTQAEAEHRAPQTPMQESFTRHADERRVDWQEPTPYRERPRSPTPTRYRNKGIEQLAEAMTKFSRNRPPPRQVTDLPNFSGAPLEWLSYKAAMRDSTRLYDFSPVENMARLRNSLRGEARESVAALLHAEVDHNVVMQTLERCFGRPEIVIDQAINDIKKLPRPGPSSAELNGFAIKLQNIVCVIQTIDQRGYLNNPMLIREVLEKLSPHLRSRWCDYAEDHGSYDVPEVVTLSRFLMREADRGLRHDFSAAATKSKPPEKPTTSSSTRRTDAARRSDATRRPDATHRAAYATTTTTTAAASTTDTSDQKKVCVCCGGEHFLHKCSKWLGLDVNLRWEVVKGSGLCFKCLEKKHRRYTCRSKACGTDDCQRAHHALLHPKSATEEEASAKEVEKKEEAVMTAATSTAEHTSVLLKVCPIIITGPKGEINTFALLDEGSTITLIDQGVADQVGLNGPTSALRIHSVNSVAGEEGSKTVTLQVRGRATDNFDIKARTVRNLMLHSQTVPADVLNFPHLRKMRQQEVCYIRGQPKILIGADNWDLIVTRQLRQGRRREPVASRTNLGWVILGHLPRTTLSDTNEVVHHLRHAPDDQLEELVKAHFHIDALGVSLKEKVRPEDERAVAIFESTARRVGQRYEVGLPWRRDDVKMPPSFDQAFRRLIAIEKKMDRDPAFADSYSAQIANMLSKGYAEESDGTETDDEKAWFLPHFAVQNVNKPGKVRLVFDAAASSSHTSLNQKLLEGPDLLKSLPGILYRFRERPIGVTADIQEMFLQIKIRKEDQPAQMFLWRGRDRQSAPKRFKMTSLIFGASSSPFLAHSVRNRNAEDFAHTHPIALEAIKNSHYMDDLVDSYGTLAEAKEAVNQVDYVHRQASFQLRGWNANDPRTLQEIPAELHAHSTTELVPGTDTTDKTLGLLWDAEKDELGFNTTMNRVPQQVKEMLRAPTKRETLSAVMSIYDPLGFLSPFTISAKILLQALWRQDIGWDEPIPEQQAEKFYAWMHGLKNISRLRLPRCYDTTSADNRKELHVFCDASEQAYAAVAYWRLEREDGTVKVVLAAAKARVAPLKAVSIPRMELQAAVLGMRLAEAVKCGHRWTAVATTYWSDSRTVLIWIRTNAKTYTPFVAHRLGEIAEGTKTRQWRWVPTKENTADDATRTDYTDGPRPEWMYGPDFLRQPKECWPQEHPDISATDEEVRVHYVATRRPPHWEAMPVAARFSKWDVLVRATARVLMMAEKWLHKATALEVRHIETAERLWLERSQEESYGEERHLLQQGRPIPRSSRLFKLDPTLGKDKLLRVRGRVGAARVDQQMKQPVVLDGRHEVTRLIVQREHEAAGHANNGRVVNDLRQRYWVIHLRPTVRAIAKACQHCRIRKSKPQVPVFGDLPAARLDPFHRPFTNIGVDYFGPMIVTVGRRREKRWGALFTCLTTRAVHLEMVPSLSTDSAIMALRRMAARRGWPSVIYSDNGTNFRGADAELRGAVEEWADELREFCLTKKIIWKYIPPGAPNQGGAWERLVRSVKTALSATLKEKETKEEILLTVLIEAEHCINARPLTHVSVSPEDPEALTPNHFLIEASSGLPLTGPCQPADRRAWRASQALADQFWRRWVREYLPTLVTRGHSAADTRRLQVGDLVVVVDAALPCV